ncbi:Htur_1727 family rSAM-partnered candidate RiPP [Halorarius halobius]|uniref:Htur_1727 family rSAM-partnered candidate RiPP n=1 Tax=Halorarius halobius TaxID=2962671 RepID=UPI0020CDDD2D|nr:Htur_1727 family rSAM-partnered candidate RiPP [Halorarius halobius]
MVERESRQRVGDHPRAAERPEWEVFVREKEGAPLRSVGSVSAQTADAAHEAATRLFAWDAPEVWVCPADEVVRYSTHDLDDDATVATPEGGEEPRTAGFEP